MNTPVFKSPGVYFEDLKHATLSPTAWTIIVYVLLQMKTSETTDIERYAHYIDGTCARLTVRNWTACSHFGDTIHVGCNRLETHRDCRLILSETGEAIKGINEGCSTLLAKSAERCVGLWMTMHNIITTK